MDPWAVLRRLRVLPLVEATTRDEDINGGDAVEALCDVRELLDEALALQAEACDPPRVGG